ncbi:PREDICTED: disease resistance-like protein CSA1 [Lupinus angustifolius]|uniref:disease resistance-like protein CSA1 n=1 Tax=Lupinus angustifolius TaxID=3871 RepID=UPI00092F3AC3|nr:PREDICTED: disease resistance-like protein CSA1 [Lupinus angustifolius]XP_019413230.1 PREDICTED: disease resistance-like protein CSA1 [Lupinus angustifolius]
MDVSNCNSITEIPNVSGAKSLRELKLDGCKNLVIVDESVGFLPNLVYFSASGCFQLQSFVPEMYLPSLEYISFNLCRSLEHFPEIAGTMDKKPLKIYLMDTSIEELPDSIGKLTGLEYLEMTSCSRLRCLPSTLFMLPNLVTLKVGGCPRLPKSFRRHEVSNSVRTLHFNGAHVSGEDLPMIIHSFPKLEDLNMSSNCFAYFPACIQDSISLKCLDVSQCRRLEEIPELPSSVQKVNARDCYSLNAETLDMLWSQVRKKINRLEIVMPIGREIPEWFNQEQVGGVPIFKARAKFPVVGVAFAFKRLNGNRTSPHWETVRLQLFIEDELVSRKQNQTFYVEDNHVLLCDLRVMFSDEEWNDLNTRLGHDWKTVQVLCETSMTLIWWGVYAYVGETNMDDIKFTTSQDYHPIVRQSQVPEISEEDKVRNMIESINVPLGFEGFMRELRADEERGLNEYDQSLLANIAKMSKWAIKLREGKSGGLSPGEEDEEEGRSMLEWVAKTTLEGEERRQRKEAAAVSYHVPQYHDDDETTIMERQLYEGESSRQRSQDDDDDVIKVQYYIFDFTKQ